MGKKEENIDYKKAYYELYDLILNLPGHVYWKNKNGDYLGCNREQAKNLGFDNPEDIIGKTYEDTHKNLEYAKKLRLIDQEIMKGGKPRTLEEPAEGGRVFLSKKIPLRDRNQKVKGLLGISFDITDSKKEITDKLELLENIIAVMPGNVYWMDRNGVYLGCNDNEARAVGLSSRKEIIGKRNIDIPDFVIPDVLDKINQQVIDTNQTIVIEEPAVLKDGTEATFLSSKVPLHDADENVVGVVGISIDITERKKAEEKVRESKIKEKAQEERIKTLESVGGMIAHEISTPIKAIEQSAEGIIDFLPRLLEGYNAAKQAELDIPHIQPRHIKSLEKALFYIKHEMYMARTILYLFLNNIQNHDLEVDSVTFKEYSIQTSVQDAVNRYPLTAMEREKIWISKTLDFTFLGQSLLMEHILLNLLSNALYFIAQAGKGHIKIYGEKGGKVNRLCFEDTGTGISAEILPQIFDQKFSRRHQGTGMGLYFCKKAMTQMKGNITCVSQENIFTRFILEFPIVK